MSYLKPTERKVKRMNINVEVDLHNAFKAATSARGENMTDILLEFIEEYVRKHTPAALKLAKEGPPMKPPRLYPRPEPRNAAL